MNTNEKTIEFHNCKTYGDEIEALIRHYAEREIGTYTLECAVEKLKTIKAKHKTAIENVIVGAD